MDSTFIRKWVLVLIFVIAVLNVGFAGRGILDPRVPTPPDSVSIREIVSDIVQGIHWRGAGRFLKHAQSTDATILQTLEGELNAKLSGLPDVRMYSPGVKIFAITSSHAKVQIDSTVISVRKSDGAGWIVEDPSSFRQMISRLERTGARSSVAPPPAPPVDITPSDLRWSEHALIPIEFDSGIWIVNQAVANAETGQDLLRAPREGEIAAVGDINTLVGFIADAGIRRILFLGTDGNWINSYGDVSHSNEHHFDEPRSIKVKKKRLGSWYIFVGDLGLHEVDKLEYFPATHSISYIQSFSANLQTPVDVDMDQDDESILVADESPGAVVMLWSNGTLKSRIETYTYQGQSYRIGRATQVLRGPWGLGFIDQSRNAFVTIYVWDYPAPGSTTAPAAYVTRFTNFPNSELSSIGYTYGKCFVVADKKLGAVHLFSEDGLYLASYSTFSSEWALSPLIFAPVAGTNMLRHVRTFSSSNQADETVAQLSSYSMDDLWTSTTGFRRFLPGADVMELSLTQDATTCTFGWKLTNRSNCFAVITDSKGNPLVTLTNEVKTPDRYTVTIAKSSLPVKPIYRFRVSALPEWNSSYIADYQQVWGMKEIVFSLTVPPPPPPPDAPMSVKEENPLPTEYNMRQNYPNPSNPSTNISVDLPVPGNMTLTIFDVTGRKVTSLANGHFDAGSHNFQWDGRNSTGVTVATGVYFFQVHVVDDKGQARFDKTGKMILLR